MFLRNSKDRRPKASTQEDDGEMINFIKSLFKKKPTIIMLDLDIFYAQQHKMEVLKAENYFLRDSLKDACWEIYKHTGNLQTSNPEYFIDKRKNKYKR